MVIIRLSCSAIFYCFVFHTNLQVLLYLLHLCGVLRDGSDIIYKLVPCSIDRYLLQLSVYEWHRRPTSFCGLIVSKITSQADAQASLGSNPATIKMRLKQLMDNEDCKEVN